MKVRDLIDNLQRNYDPDEEVVYTLWSGQDIDDLSDTYEDDEDSRYVDLDLDQDDKNAIMLKLERLHDKGYEISFQALEQCVDEYLDEHPNEVTE